MPTEKDSEIVRNMNLISILNTDRQGSKLFYGLCLSYVVSHEPRKRCHKEHDIKQNEYSPVRQHFA